jgi:hypothetical protein
MLNTIVTAVVTLVAAFVGAWAGAKFHAKAQEKSQRELLKSAQAMRHSLSAIARRMPGGVANPTSLSEHPPK